ncbi:hypothetical protein Btru_056994 [Bulinus truncatus]|nr:hypothetical protein Btru_056994 [Bulinus truncatus]
MIPIQYKGSQPAWSVEKIQEVITRKHMSFDPSSTVSLLKSDPLKGHSLIRSGILNKNSKMGMKWGNLATNIRGVIYYSLSPYEQKAFAGAISKGVPNLFRRFRGQVFRVTPPFIAAYLVYDWAQKEHERLMRKDPKEFCNDE